MTFRYFQGPDDEMVALVEGETECSLCGQTGECFELEYAICEELSDEEKATSFGCDACLQSGRFEFSHETEMGSLDETGLSPYRPTPFPVAEFPAVAMEELRRTPQIVTWQEERWLAHCTDFMAYVGTWQPSDFVANSPSGDGRALFLDMTDEDEAHLWDESMDDEDEAPASWHATYYVFECLHCGKLRGNWDCD